MGTEIERKFLVKSNVWRSQADGKLYRQGYIVKSADATVRVRVAGARGFLTLKGRAENFARPEFEYEIPLADAQEMLDLWCHPRIVEKIRYCIPVGDLIWEVDEFQGFNRGLVLAEVELDASDRKIDLPDWVGAEVSEQARYYNSNLAIYPYSLWTPEEIG
ncbi:CYTH domain-containing protein [Altericista sp. CCNU0014]|uniref:CYTH domain-containing protein n=1 Tax=Altericista sp. CCNU0014 TaxID=3082949 RepID=UPI00384CF9AF